LSKLKDVKHQRNERRHQRCEEKKIKLRRFVAWCWKSFLDFERKHKLVEKSTTVAKEHLNSLVEQYLPNDPPTEGNNPQPSSSPTTAGFA
jgi:hypothetical protein